MKRIVALLLALGLTLMALPSFAAPAPGLDSLRQVPDVQTTTAYKGQSQLVVYYQQAGADQVAELGLSRAQVKRGTSLSDSVDLIEFASCAEAEQALQDLRQSPDVLAADYNDCARLTALPNDPFVLDGSEWQFEQIGADRTWNTKAGSTTIVIAVLDSGADTTHPDLQGRLARGYDYIRGTSAVIDTLGHGTAVVGCAVAAANNALGVAGIAGKANVKVAPYRVCSDTSVPVSNVVAAIDTILSSRPEVRVINMSFCMYTPNAALEAAVARARAAGIIIVAAAGNDGGSAYQYPASFDGVISVGATDARDDIASFSQHNDKVDLSAPGVSVATTLPGGSYGYGGGTSFSAPIVSACCAVLLNKKPDLSAQEVESVLYQTALDLGAAGRDPYYGEGRVRLDLAWKAIIVPPKKEAAPPPKTGDDASVALWIALMAASAAVACAVIMCRKKKKRK